MELKSRMVLAAEDIRFRHVRSPVADMPQGGSFSCGACSRRPRAPAHVPHDADVPPEQRPVHVGHLVVRITPARLLLLAWLARAGPFASGNGA